MAEYIDKQELLSSLEKKIKSENERRMAVVDRDFIDIVNDATAISDMVEVVRCKDCRYFIHFADGRCYCDNANGLDFAKHSDYCSYGERRS